MRKDRFYGACKTVFALFGLLLLAVADAMETEGLRIFYAEVPAIRAASIYTAPGQQKAAAVSTLSFEAYGRQFDLELQSNARLLESLPADQRDELTGGYSLYRGKLSGLSGSWVRLLRHGEELRGVIWDGHDLYTLEPARKVTPFLVDPVDASGSEPVIYRLSDTQSDIDLEFCQSLVPDTPDTPLQKFQNLGVELRAATALATGASRRLEISAIADFDFYQLSGADTETELLARMNIVDGIFSEQTGVSVAVGEVRVLSESNVSLSSTSANTLLEQLGDLRRNDGTLRNTGLTHLVTGKDLDGGTVGIAYVGSLCRDRSSASLSEGRHSLTYSALIAAHEIGHNFGAPHDAEEGSICASTTPTFLMARNLNGSRAFSACSLEQIQPRIAAATCISEIQAAAPGDTDGSATTPPSVTPPTESGGGGGTLDELLLLLLLATAGHRLYILRQSVC